MFRRIPAFLAALSITVAPAPAQSGEPSDRTELLANVLDSVVETSPVDERAASLRALRDLEDESLRPLFAHFAARRDPLLRAGGIFALASYEDPPAVNTQMLAKIESTSEQAGLIGDAITEGLLSDTDIDEILRWSSHTPAVEALLIATLGDRMDTPENRERLYTLSSGDSPRAALVADLLLIHLDGSSQRIETFVSELVEMDEAARLARLSFLLMTIRQNELAGTGPLLLELYRAFGDDPRVEQDVLGTLMLIEPSLAKKPWREAFESAESLAPRLRLAFHALSASHTLPLGFFEGVEPEPDSPLLTRVIEVARANTRGEPTQQQLLDLIDMRQRTAVLWVVEATDEMSEDRAIPLLQRVIETGLSRGDRRRPVSPVFVEAGARLAERRPEELRDPIRRADENRDTPATEALLAAVLRDGSALPWTLDGAPGWHDNRAKALATIAEARLAPGSLDDASRLERLDRVALGYGELPQLFRVQAAWLALKARGEARRAIARLMSETTNQP